MSTTLQAPRTAAPTGEAVPPFEPHPWLAGPHLQTIAGRFWPGPSPRLPATYAEVDVGGGDRVGVLESIPLGWRAGDPSAILVHGLGGDARSRYILRVGSKLLALGARVVRMNLRGAGPGFGSSRSYYHSGMTEDLRAVAARLARRAPGSPIALVGFSLGANLCLKLAAEASDSPVPGLDCVVAANPPIDLAACCGRMSERANRAYDRNFLRNLRAQVDRLHSAYPELGAIDLSSARSLREFDELYTAPRNGFADAADYYARASAGPLLGRIEVPGLVIHAADDPFIPAGPFLAAEFPPGLALELIPGGGHLGFLSKKSWRGDRRWLDARICSWLAARWEVAARDREATAR